MRRSRRPEIHSPVFAANATRPALKHRRIRIPDLPQSRQSGMTRLRQQAPYGGGPSLKLALARGGVHLRRETLVALPQPVKAIRLRKEAGAQPGQIGSAERGRFGDA